MSDVNPSIAAPAPRALADLEAEIEELGRQVGSIAAAGTDFAIRLDRRSTSLIAALEEVRAAGQLPGRALPADFWRRTATAITALTGIREAALTALR
jgi:hypothetical protein